MSSLKKNRASEKKDKNYARALSEHKKRLAGYRERSLALFPWICAHCGREFPADRLRELTVHHKDHNHDNNPNDGSNWELLCIYCHDNEHSTFEDAKWLEQAGPEKVQKSTPMFKPFADLDKKLQEKK
ncbi:MAG: HNH endonuclease [uncultured bacterium]|nr:MAG: HNH endonuclease [uncultured bacterium]HLD43978.1 YajD family HNH nuclease [bacterium]